MQIENHHNQRDHLQGHAETEKLSNGYEIFLATAHGSVRGFFDSRSDPYQRRVAPHRRQPKDSRNKDQEHHIERSGKAEE